MGIAGQGGFRPTWIARLALGLLGMAAATPAGAGPCPRDCPSSI